MATQYDIFISYRRDAFESANLFATRLKALGYRVFFDLETMNAGKFNEQLLDVISKCKDFVLVLSPNALERCNDEGDWVRRETLCAMEHKKNIIPVMLSGFVWPTEMPKGMEELCNYQALAPAPNTYYDLQIKKLTGYLTSTAYFHTRKRWLIGLSIMIIVLANLMIIARVTYMPVAQQIAEAYTIQTQCINDLSGVSQTLQSEWVKYVSDYEKEKNPEDKADSKQLMRNMIQLEQRERDALYQTMSGNTLHINAIYFPMLWAHGINPAEIWAYNNIWQSFFNDLDEQMTAYSNMMEDDGYTMINMRLAQIHSIIIVAYANSFYYAYLQMLTHLPKSTHKRFYEESHDWHNLPSAGIGWSDEEYERQQKLLDDAVQDDLAQLSLFLTQTESELTELDKRLQNLEILADSMNNMLNDIH